VTASYAASMSPSSTPSIPDQATSQANPIHHITPCSSYSYDDTSALHSKYALDHTQSSSTPSAEPHPHLKGNLAVQPGHHSAAQQANTPGPSTASAPQAVVTRTMSVQHPTHLLCLQHDWPSLAAQCRSLAVEIQLVAQVCPAIVHKQNKLRVSS